MNGRQLLLGVALVLSVAHLVSDGETTYRLLKQFR
jgi:hypothetical protein